LPSKWNPPGGVGSIKKTYWRGFLQSFPQTSSTWSKNYILLKIEHKLCLVQFLLPSASISIFPSF
jgi:hypothetical protein